MDKSKKYIDMCEKAEEIQEEWKPQHGDIIQQRHTNLKGVTKNYLDPLLVVEDICKDRVIAYYPESVTDKTSLVMVCWRVGNKWFNETNGYWWWVWLPRQDQLQKIARQHATWYDTREINNFCLFWNWWRESDQELYHRDDVTLEQLWLAFVMSVKYHKTWNEGEWKEETWHYVEVDLDRGLDTLEYSVDGSEWKDKFDGSSIIEWQNKRRRNK